MSKCTTCGSNLIGTPETLAQPQECKRCTIQRLEKFISEVLKPVKRRLADGEADEEDDRIISLAADHQIENVRRVKYDMRIHGVMDFQDGDEIYWWGSSETSLELLGKFEAESKHWYCTSCGEQCQALSAKWRFNGDEWEHHHDYPMGHVLAERRAP